MLLIIAGGAVALNEWREVRFWILLVYAPVHGQLPVAGRSALPGGAFPEQVQGHRWSEPYTSAAPLRLIVRRSDAALRAHAASAQPGQIRDTAPQEAWRRKSGQRLFSQEAALASSVRSTGVTSVRVYCFGFE